MLVEDLSLVIFQSLELRFSIFYVTVWYVQYLVRPHVGSGVNKQIKQELSDNLSSSKMKSCY